MSGSSKDIVTLALGAAVLLALVSGRAGGEPPPAGARSAIELIANKPSRRFAQSVVASSTTNQTVLKEQSR